ncbi:MAG: prepilin peptidase [Candidatus Paceibacterota bacterium]
MSIYYHLFSLGLGLIIGSFLNVVILRYNTGRTLSGRSGCFSCGRKLRWYELVPVLGFVGLRGRCRNCHSQISWQYPLVELLTGFLFALIYWRLGGGWLGVIFYWLIASLLIIITVYDLKHKIIPDCFVLALILLGLLKPLFFNQLLTSAGSFNFALVKAFGWGLVGGLAVALPLFILWVISKGRWLGFGDVKLALGLGLLLGWPAGLSALILAFWLGAIIGLLLIGWGKTQLWRKGKSYTMKSEIPFAPFLVLGFWLVFLFSINVLIFF